MCGSNSDPDPQHCMLLSQRNQISFHKFQVCVKNKYSFPYQAKMKKQAGHSATDQKKVLID